MYKFTRFLILSTIMVSGTQCISVPFVNLSIFQIALLFTGLISVLEIPRRLGRHSVKKALPLILLWFLSNILAYATSTNHGWAKSYLLLGFMSVFIFVVIPAFFDASDKEILLKTLIRSQYIVIPFSIINYILFYKIGMMPEEIPLGGGFTVELGEEALDRGTAAGEMRLMLPYSTPPVLSIVMGMCIMLLLFSKDLFNKYVKLVLILVFSTILIMTGSRTGIIGIALTLLFLFLGGDLRSYIRKLPLGWILFSLILAVVVIVVFNDNEYIQKMVINRFSGVDSDSMDDDRHFLVPLDGLLIWMDNISNFILGIGYGSSINMKGAHTYLPPYFLNSYVTMVAERGILGLLIIIILISQVGNLYKARKLYDNNSRAYIYAFMAGLFCCIFYEGFICYFLLFTIPISFIIEKNKPALRKNNKSSLRI